MSCDVQLNKRPARVGIIGGGIAGATVALCLGKLDLDVTLMEQGPTLVNGPPICHLHAGGNLYREISDEQCLTLLRESIDLLRFYPNAIDYRPTVVAVPINDDGEPDELLTRLYKLQSEYQRLIELDPLNNVLGRADDYFQLFTRSQIEALKNKDIVDTPSTLDEWMIPFAHHVNLDQLKFPVIMVQEYGLNLFRLAASSELALQKIANCATLTNTNVIAVNRQTNCWQVETQSKDENHILEFDYLINAAGFRSGLIDDMAGFKRQRFVEFKAAYVTQWPGCDVIWPEVIFLGERGTPNGMAQFTPYPDGYFQLHGMTKSITLFDDGLVESTEQSAQPQLNDHLLEKIDNGWPVVEVDKRTQGAIDHLTRFIPAFSNNATITAKPLYGAQQIPGQDVDLRAAGVSFSGENYARCEIVKASSVLTVADEIIEQLSRDGLLIQNTQNSQLIRAIATLSDQEITASAHHICERRNYPTSLARRNIASKK